MFKALSEFIWSYVNLERQKKLIHLSSMIRKTLAIFLILLIQSSYFSVFISFLSFKANQKYISVALCVNKAKPNLNCLGKCYFEKELKNSNDAEKSLKPSAKKIRDELPLIAVLVVAPKPPIHLKLSLPSGKTIYQFKHSQTVFHPPTPCLI